MSATPEAAGVVEIVSVESGKKVMTEAIPYCFMEGYEQYIAEQIIPETRVEDATWTVKNYTNYRLTEGKVKGEPCKGCSYNNKCEGPWKEYPEMYGWEEFEPIMYGMKKE